MISHSFFFFHFSSLRLSQLTNFNSGCDVMGGLQGIWEDEAVKSSDLFHPKLGYHRLTQRIRLGCP